MGLEVAGQEQVGTGAYRLVWEDDDFGVGRLRVYETVWCPKATPGCENCLDYGEWVGEDSEVEPCPDCDGVCPGLNIGRDGKPEVNRGA